MTGCDLGGFGHTLPFETSEKRRIRESTTSSDGWAISLTTEVEYFSRDKKNEKEKSLKSTRQKKE